MSKNGVKTTDASPVHKQMIEQDFRKQALKLVYGYSKLLRIWLWLQSGPSQHLLRVAEQTLDYEGLWHANNVVPSVKLKKRLFRPLLVGILYEMATRVISGQIARSPSLGRINREKGTHPGAVFGDQNDQSGPRALRLAQPTLLTLQTNLH